MRNIVWTEQQVDQDGDQTQDGHVRVARYGASQIVLDKLLLIPEAASTKKVYRVLVVDDSVLPRVAARAMLNAMSGFRLCGEAASGQEALQAVTSLKPDLVLMDVHMPGIDGPEVTKALLVQHPELKIIAWTVSESSDDLLRMMQAGCCGYVLKDVGPNELHRALMAVVRSDNPVPRKMIPEVLRRVAQQAPISQPRDISLTSREMQILRAIAKGRPTKRIAQDIGLAIPSVESHLQNIFRKLAATNRGEAVSTALKVGLITLADL